MKNSKSDILFEKMMEQVIREEGKRLLEENERLKNDPAAIIPEELNWRMLELIAHSFPDD